MARGPLKHRARCLPISEFGVCSQQVILFNCFVPGTAAGCKTQNQRCGSECGERFSHDVLLLESIGYTPFSPRARRPGCFPDSSPHVAPAPPMGVRVNALSDPGRISASW